MTAETRRGSDGVCSSIVLPRRRLWLAVLANDLGVFFVSLSSVWTASVWEMPLYVLKTAYGSLAKDE